MPDKNNIRLRTLAFAVQQVSNAVTEIQIDDYISKEKSFDWWSGEEGTEITSRDFKEQLDAITTPEIVLVMNSGGGDAFEGAAIANMVREKIKDGKKITCRIPALCASAAVDIACACQSVSIYRNAYMMIHEAAAFMAGTYQASKIQPVIGMLNTVNEAVADNYSQKCGKPKEDVLQLMKDTTWFSGQSAVEAGFADELIDEEAEPMHIEPGPQQRYLINGLAAVAAADFKTAPDALKAALENIPNKTTQKGDLKMEIKTTEELKKQFPELCQQIETAAADSAVKKERTRMQELDKVSGQLPPDAVEKAKYTDFTEAKDVVYQAAIDGKLQSKIVLNSLKDDAAAAGAVPASANGGAAEGSVQMSEHQKKQADARELAKSACKN